MQKTLPCVLTLTFATQRLQRLNNEDFTKFAFRLIVSSLIKVLTKTLTLISEYTAFQPPQLALGVRRGRFPQERAQVSAGERFIVLGLLRGVCMC